MSEVLRQAQAVVRFRLMRALGRFRLAEDGTTWSYFMCTCGRHRDPLLKHGPPPGLGHPCPRTLVADYQKEIVQLCSEHFVRWDKSRPDRRDSA